MEAAAAVERRVEGRRVATTMEPTLWMGLNVIWEEERKPAEESLLHSATILSMVVHERDDVSSAYSRI